MAGYTQTELAAIFSAAGVASTDSQRRLADIILRAYTDIGVIRVVETTGGAGAPKYNYNTRKYFSAMARPLVELVTACYGQDYTDAQITALAQTEPYGPLSYSFATYLPDIVRATFACMELGAECLGQGNFASQTLWTVANGLAKSTAGLTYTHNAGANTATQTAAQRVGAGSLAEVLQNSKWYVFDFTISTASPTIANLTSYKLSAAVCSVATNIAPITAAGFGTAEKKSLFFQSAVAADVADFVLTVVSADVGANNIITNFSLKRLISYDAATTYRNYSTNPLSNFTATQAELYGSLGSNYCKRFIAATITTTLQKIAEGEYGVYGTLNKVAEPVLDTWTT